MSTRKYPHRPEPLPKLCCHQPHITNQSAPDSLCTRSRNVSHVPVVDKQVEHRRLSNMDVMPEPHETKEKDRGLLPPFSRVGLHHFPIIPKTKRSRRSAKKTGQCRSSEVAASQPTRRGSSTSSPFKQSI
jgi:hypothetical protein